MAENTNQNSPQQQREFNDAINDYRSLLRNISDELGKQRTHVADANAEYKKLDSIAKQLQNTEEGISGLTSEQLDKIKGKYEMSLKEIKNQAQQLLLQKGITNLTQTQLNYLTQRGKLDDKSAALLQGYLDDLELEKSFLETIERTTQKRLEYESKVKDLTGATGAILEGMKGSMNALGLSSMSNYLNIDAAKKAMEEEADAIARGEKEGGKMSVRMAGIKTLAEGLNKSLFSTEAVLTFIVSQLAKGSQNMADFRKQTGMGYQSAYQTNMEMKGIAMASNDNFITSEKLNKSYSMMTEQLGVSADILGGTALVSATNLSERLGMSAESASQLTSYTRLQGENTEAILGNAVGTVGAFNKQNKTAINVKQVMNDVAGASKSTYLNMGKNVEAMAATATKARALGLSLGQVEKISESLLNFEESIGTELQANLLLGGGVNLAKAREAALTGDTAKLTDEIGKQEGIRNAFATKNVIAQKAAADALGISKEELAQMALQQDLNNLSAKDFKDRYGETTYESMKSRSATEKLGDAMAKVTDILGSLVQVFSPFLDLLAYVLANPIAPWILAGAIAAKVLSSNVGGIGKAFGSMFSAGKQALSGLAGLFKKGGFSEALGGLKDKLTGGDKAKGLATDKAGDAAGAADKTTNTGEGFKKKMQNIAEGIKAFGNKEVLFGALNLIPSSIGLIAMIPGVVGAKLIEQIKGEKFKESLEGLAGGISKMGTGSVLLGAGGLILTSVGLIAMIPGVAAGLLLAATAKPISMGLEILGKGLEAFGKSMMTGYGLIGLAAVAVGAIALGAALNLAAPGIQAFGTVVTAVFTGLATLIPVIVDGFVTLLTAITTGIGPMLLLGPALFGIAGGLAAVAFAGIMSLPAIGGLIALSLAAPALVSLGMGGETASAGEAKGKTDEGSLAAVEAKLDALVAAVRAGGNVYLDSNKVGRAQVLGSYKSS